MLDKHDGWALDRLAKGAPGRARRIGGRCGAFPVETGISAASSGRCLAAAQPIGEAGDLDAKQQVCRRQLGTAACERVPDDLLKVVDRVELDARQSGNGWIDVAGNGEIDQQQWPRSGAAAVCDRVLDLISVQDWDLARRLS